MKRRAAIAIVSVSFVVAAQDVFAFCTEFIQLLWKGWDYGKTVQYRFDETDINLADPYVRTCIGAGLRAWQGINNVNITEGTSQNVDYVTIRWAYPGNPNYRETAYATATWAGRHPSGHISRGDIYINPQWAQINPSDCTSMAWVMAHEMGHLFGLGHSQQPNSGQLMQPQVSYAVMQSSRGYPLPCEAERAMHALTFIGPIQADNAFGGDCGSGAFDGWLDRKNCCTNKAHIVSTGSNFRPHGHIMGLLNNSTLPAGASGEVRLDYFDVDGSVYRVDWRLNGVTIHTTYSEPFTMPYSNAQPGSYVVDAVLYDHANDYYVSDPIAIVVSALVMRPDTLQSGQKLYPNEAIGSPNGLYSLFYQTDGNFVLYGPSGPIIWTGTSGSPSFVHAEEHTGNVVVVNQWVAWQTFTHGNSGAGMRVGNDGVVRVISRKGPVVWQAP